MPKRTDIKSILVIGSGPIVIGQACEFDYSGTQAIKALREEGYRVVLINSNPATIMTDPELADAVYVEPLTPEFVEKVIAREKPDAVLPTMGGQTALNLSLELHRQGILERHGVRLLGATPDAIEKAENREKFKNVMDSIGVESARSRVARTLDDGREILKEIGLPLILRPSFTLGGEGGGATFTEEQFLAQLERALFLSPTGECLVEESLLGWKEFELEVVRDRNDNVVIVCSIENFDPMGVHTGDSITVAPAQTLTDREYQQMRDQSIRIIRAIGVETGGSNIQFSVNPKNGRIIVIEMNPRVSRSSALASKATGFPIARVAAKLAIGYTLDELTNDITGTTPCSFEPSIDYVVVKVPRFDFEKFRPTDPVLGTQMKSVGEVMAMGHSFEEALCKALTGLETKRPWFSRDVQLDWEHIEKPYSDRIWHLAQALRQGASPTEVSSRSGIDRWFLDRMARVLALEPELKKWPASKDTLLTAKRLGWPDRAIAEVAAVSEATVRATREAHGIRPAFQQVDTCAGEFEAHTPYFYSTYAGTNEALPPANGKPRVLVLGGGPNRVGQGIEFDYCCVHAAMSLRQAGFEVVMVNCNPETVSTDFDQSDRLYFEPLTPESVLAIAQIEKPIGAIVQLGGQTPLKIAAALEEGGLKILGTSVDSIDVAEDRARFDAIAGELKQLNVLQPPAGTARTHEEAQAVAQKLGYPLLLRPSYVLGGRGMKIVYSDRELTTWVDEALSQSGEHPVLLDRFLNHATEVDIDALCDGDQVLIGGMMEHIEEAGIHSGDSACSLPVATLPQDAQETIRRATRFLGKRLGVVGLMNAQFAITRDGDSESGKAQVYLLEVNPRASRTVPFVSKAIGIPLAKIAAMVMVGKKLKDLGYTQDFDVAILEGKRGFAVKAPVFVFHKFPKVDILLGPEMKSTGEVMGRGKSFLEAYGKAITGAGMRLPTSGRVFFSIKNSDKAEAAGLARSLAECGFELEATSGTAEFLNAQKISCHSIAKLHELPDGNNCVAAIRAGRYALVVNTTEGEKSIADSFSIRRAVLERKLPYATVLSSARAMVGAIAENQRKSFEVSPLGTPPL